jgi:hypothetical protein
MSSLQRMNADSYIQLLGIVVTAAVAVWTLQRSFANERKKRTAEQEEEVKAFLGALSTEVNTLWPVYMEQYGKTLENLKEGERPGQFPVGSGYFVVYQSNAHLLGRIPSAALRNQIVRSYIIANGMLDTIGLYGSMLISARETAGGVQRVGSAEALTAEWRWRSVESYAMQMKEQHFKLRAEFLKLQEALTEFREQAANRAYEESQKTVW